MGSGMVWFCAAGCALTSTKVSMYISTIVIKHLFSESDWVPQLSQGRPVNCSPSVRLPRLANFGFRIQGMDLNLGDSSATEECVHRGHRQHVCRWTVLNKHTSKRVVLNSGPKCSNSRFYSGPCEKFIPAHCFLNVFSHNLKCYSIIVHIASISNQAGRNVL